MINQISPVQTKTEALPSINRALLQVRHLQATVKARAAAGILPAEQRSFWSPATTGPFLVPVTRWHE